ncbi:MAG: thioredoxin domain-containing protein [Bacteroidota bacterium]
MKKLSIIFILAISISIISCGNIQGNQSGEDVKIENNGGEELSEVAPEYLTYETFKEKVWDFEKNPEEWKYEGDVPCVIDFYADWCKPCKMVAPIMDDLAKKYDGKVKIYKIDTDKEKKLAGVFGIRSIPSVLFSPMEGKPMMQTGALQKDAYIKIIEEELLNKKQ